MMLSLCLAALALGDYTIDLPVKPRESQRLAARELEDVLGRATGRKAVADGKLRFVLARGPEGTERPAAFSSLSERRGDVVYLWGDDAGSYPGTLYAVYGFLAKRLGAVWAYPGEDGLFVPRRTEMEFPEGVRDTFEPRYAKGVFRSVHHSSILGFQDGLPSELKWSETEAKARVSEIEAWHRRHRLFSRENFTCGHAFTEWQKRFEKTHPEFLSLRDDGTRVGLKWQNPTTTKLCVSNPDVLDQILADWKAAGTPKYLNVCENDGFNYCVCKNCKALDTDPPGEDFNLNKTDRYLWFWNRLAEKARQVRPDVQLVTYIYSSYRFPPRRERIEYPENMCFGIVPTFTDDIRAFLADWAKAGLKRFFLRPNFHCAYSVLPRGVEKYVYDVYAYCCRHGLVGVDFDADFGRYPLRPENYVTCRMIAEPEGSFETFMDEFCSAFGEAKEEVSAYYAGIRSRYEARCTNVNAEARKGIMLDDSGMAKFQTRFHTEAELMSDIALLEKAAARPFADSLAAKRTKDLVVFARHYLLAWRFLDAAGAQDAPRLAAVAKELVDFRIAHQDVLGDFYGMNMFGNWRGLENRIWKKMAVRPWEKQVSLVDNGVAKCRIVLAEDASKAVRFAADEFAKYFAVATHCGKVPVGTKSDDGLYPIRIRTSTAVDGLKEDGFLIEATASGLTVTGYNDAGAIYGAYEILKKYAGMRWVTPGEDGEYCVHTGRSVVVPFGKDLQNPNLKVRVTIGCDSKEGILWHLRNNMDAPIVKFLDKEARTSGPCGHIMSDLLIGDWGKTRQETLNRLYEEHSEYFPLIDGKRVKINRSVDPNPCISNPALLDRMAENFLTRLADRQETHDYLTIGNNDTTVWCQCEKCRTLDPAETKNTRGELSDRYWYMVNEIARRVWAKRPDAKLGGWAYQNFWYAPAKVKPDPRLRVLVSFNNQCWRHTCCDPKCEVNKEMVKIYASWKKLGMPIVMNRDEIGTWDGQGGPGCELIPAESVLRRNICEDYPKLGCNGSNFCVPGPFPRFSDFAKKYSPYFGKRYHWYAMWQTCYMSAKCMWNANAEYDATLEEANRLFYGAGWEGGMRDFRALLAECFFGAPGCIGWGQGTTTGRCLERPGSEEKLRAFLEKALAAAKASGDARAVEHVAREKEIFELTWLVARKRYVESYREMTAYKRTGEIVIDGILDENDWRSADAYSDFALASWLRKTLKEVRVKTVLKIVYDRDYLYFGVEAEEPKTDKMIAGESVDRFAQMTANLGNHLELFYSYPDMDQATWHMMVNSKGQIIDALQKSATVRDLSVVTKAKWAVKVLDGRWTLEMAVPCSEIGQNILDGMTWKVNCARVREVEGEPRELSSAANGRFHGTANFVNVKFLAERP